MEGDRVRVDHQQFIHVVGVNIILNLAVDIQDRRVFIFAQLAFP